MKLGYLLLIIGMIGGVFLLTMVKNVLGIRYIGGLGDTIRIDDVTYFGLWVASALCVVAGAVKTFGKRR